MFSKVSIEIGTVGAKSKSLSPSIDGSIKRILIKQSIKRENMSAYNLKENAYK